MRFEENQRPVAAEAAAAQVRLAVARLFRDIESRPNIRSIRSIRSVHCALAAQLGSPRLHGMTAITRHARPSVVVNGSLLSLRHPNGVYASIKECADNDRIIFVTARRELAAWRRDEKEEARHVFCFDVLAATHRYYP